MAGRPPRNRAGNYAADAQQLIHLARALMVDKKIATHKKESIRDKLLDIARELMFVQT